MVRKFIFLLLGCLTMNTQACANGGLVVGKEAPWSSSISLLDENGSAWNLFAHRGKVVVLYFYPKDGTPGCTAQACGLRDSYRDFDKLGALIVGVNYERVAKHKAFKDEHRLPFTLLSDILGDFARLYEANRWWPNLMPQRKTIIIDKRGVVRFILPNIDVKTHKNVVLDHVRELSK